MDTALLIGLLVVAVLVVGGLAVWFYLQKRRQEQFAERFGPEYQRAVREAGDRRKAEDELEKREERVRQLEIRSMTPEERRNFARRWDDVQAEFVDDPQGAIGKADRLVQEAMEVRGYPVGDFEQQAADLSVDHPKVVSHYRSAHAVAVRHEEDGVETEELRRAMVEYRALFGELLESEQEGGEPTNERAHERAETTAGRR